MISSNIDHIPEDEQQIDHEGGTGMLVAGAVVIVAVAVPVAV